MNGQSYGSPLGFGPLLQNTPIFGRLAGTVAALTIYAAARRAARSLAALPVPTAASQFHGFLGLVLGTLLVFRTNTSYDRWWEGRKLWGQLVNDIRNLAIKVQTCVRADRADKHRSGRWLVDFALALKGHLRRGVRLADFTDFDAPSKIPAAARAGLYRGSHLRAVRSLATKRAARRLRAAIPRSSMPLR